MQSRAGAPDAGAGGDVMAMAGGNDPKTKFLSLELSRGVAAFLVLMYHIDK